MREKIGSSFHYVEEEIVKVFPYPYNYIASYYWRTIFDVKYEFSVRNTVSSFSFPYILTIQNSFKVGDKYYHVSIVRCKY